VFVIVEGFYSLIYFFQLTLENVPVGNGVGLFTLKFQPAPDFRKTVPETPAFDGK